MTDLYTKEERTEARQELQDCLTGVRWEDEMIEDVKKIKEAIYNPEQGLYARVRDLGLHTQAMR